MKNHDAKNHEARIERMYALAEKLGRLTGQAHNLASQLSAKMVAGRIATRSANPPRPSRPPRTKKR